MQYEEILTYFNGVKRINAHTAICSSPLRSDTDPSLQITKGADGRTVVKDFGDPRPSRDVFPEIAAAVGLKPSDFFGDEYRKRYGNTGRWKRDADNKADSGFKTAAEYSYNDINTGEYAFTKIRYEDGSGKKTFKFGKIKDGRFVLSSEENKVDKSAAVYGDVQRIKEAAAAGERIFICEGEKDVDTLTEYGYTAFTSGSSNDQVKYADTLAQLATGADIVILADNDKPGKEAAAAVLKACQITAKSVKVVLPDKDREKADVTDYFTELHKTKAEFNSLVDTVDDILAIQTDGYKAPLSFRELLHADIKPPMFPVDGMIPEGLTIIAAPPKTGKSWLMLDLCFSVAQGKPFLGRDTIQGDTLYFDLELAENSVKQRLQVLYRNNEEPPVNAGLKLLDSITTGEDKILQIGTGFENVLEMEMQHNKNLRLVIIDTYQIISSPKRRDETQYAADYRNAKALQRIALKYHVAVVCVHHTTQLKHPEDVYAEISGTNGLIGAADANIVISKEKRTDRFAMLHVSGRHAREMTARIELDRDRLTWINHGEIDIDEYNEEKQLLREYESSDIREAIIKIADEIDEPWTGLASAIKTKAANSGIEILSTPKQIGLFITKFQSHLKKYDKVPVIIMDNGSGGKKYRISPLWKPIDPKPAADGISDDEPSDPDGKPFE